MRHRGWLIIVALWLAACTAVPTASPTPPATAVAQLPTATASPRPATASRRPTVTPTPSPTATPSASATVSATATPSITPTPPGIATVATATPASAAVCVPTGATDGLTLDFMTLSTTDTYWSSHAIDARTVAEMAYINAAGPDETLAAMSSAGWHEGVEYAYTDLTNDGVPELVVNFVALNVFSCQEGHYQLLLQVRPADIFSPSILALADLNRDGLSELVVGNTPCGIHGCLDVTVWSWDGANFEDLVGGEPLFQTGNPAPFPEVRVEDVDGDGFLELLLSGDIPYNFDYDIGGPWRLHTDVYGWHGELFTLRESSYSAPEYRFQALQDGDRALENGDYAAALVAYETVINNDTLDWWSPAKQENWVAVQMSTHGTDPSPTPLPGDGGLERTQLSAYAYFRLTLLHLLQGQAAEAQAAYATLQAQYAASEAGRPYAELGAAFWTTYSLNQDLSAGCLAAQIYAEQHPDLLIPLGSDYHGWQSPTYTPEMICPVPQP